MRILLSILGMIWAGAAAALPTPEPPNFVLVVLDDVGFSDVGAYGGEIPTPNLDQLAQGGMRLTQFYTMGASSQTRAALLTGRPPHQAGMRSGVWRPGQPALPDMADRGWLPLAVPTLAEVLGVHGYAAYMAGKWDVGETRPNWPVDRGFSRFFGVIGGADDDILIADGDKRWHPHDGFDGAAAFTDAAIDFLSEHQASQPGAPFFLYLAYDARLVPADGAAAMMKKKRSRRATGPYAKGWEKVREARLSNLSGLGFSANGALQHGRPAGIAAVPKRVTSDVVAPMSQRATRLMAMDQGVGRLMNALTVQGVADNTLVLVLAQNRVPSYHQADAAWEWVSGAPFGVAGPQGPGPLAEGQMRTPLIAHWPRHVAPGSVDTQTVAQVTDIAPTLFQLARFDIPPGTEGYSFSSALAGDPSVEDRVQFWMLGEAAAVREGDWKAVQPRADAPWQLYNVTADPAEVINLAQKHRVRMNGLTRMWEQYMAPTDKRAPSVAVKSSEEATAGD